MQPEVIGELVNAAIPFLGGVYAILVGYRYIGKKSGDSPKYDEWHNRFGRLFKLAGPSLVLFAFYQGITGIISVANPAVSIETADWKRYLTSDGVCSVEFPKEPTQINESAFGVESSKLELSLPAAQDIYFTLTFSDVPEEAPPATDEERLDAIRESIPTLGAQMGLDYKFVHEVKTSEAGVSGREFEFNSGKKHSFRAKVFILKNRIYRAIAVTQRTEDANAVSRRFLNSFRFEEDSQR